MNKKIKSIKELKNYKLNSNNTLKKSNAN